MGETSDGPAICLGSSSLAIATDIPFIACVINLPCTFNRYLDMSSLQFCFMIWIVVF